MFGIQLDMCHILLVCNSLEFPLKDSLIVHMRLASGAVILQEVMLFGSLCDWICNS